MASTNGRQSRALALLTRLGRMTALAAWAAVAPEQRLNKMQVDLRELTARGLVCRFRGGRWGGSEPYRYGATKKGAARLDVEATDWRVARTGAPPPLPGRRQPKISDAAPRQDDRHQDAVVSTVLSLDKNLTILGEDGGPVEVITSLRGATRIGVPNGGGRHRIQTGPYEPVFDFYGWAVRGVQGGASPLVPDALIELVTFDEESYAMRDIFIEVDRTGQATKNIDKLCAYDSFFTKWRWLLDRYRWGWEDTWFNLELRSVLTPLLLFVGPNKSMQGMVAMADQVLTGLVFPSGYPDKGCYPGRESVVFCTADAFGDVVADARDRERARRLGQPAPAPRPASMWGDMLPALPPDRRPEGKSRCRAVSLASLATSARGRLGAADLEEVSLPRRAEAASKSAPQAGDNGAGALAAADGSAPGAAMRLFDPGP
jgi:hypothetical protein